MLGSYLLTFREVLEAALVTAIILAYLSRSGRGVFKRSVWYGVYAAVAASLALGAVVWLVYGTVSKETQVLFEGIAALVAVAVLSSMIYWMATHGKVLREEIEQKLESISFKTGAALGLALFSFIVVVREGIETVLFLTPFLVQDAPATLLGFGAGLVSALILSYAIFKVGMTINLRRFFYFTSILLILLAGGLTGYGVHELLDYGKLVKVDTGWLGSAAYSLNIPAESIWHHKGIVGSILNVMLGYTVKAEWARVIVHVLYLAIALPLTLKAYSSPQQPEGKAMETAPSPVKPA
ncbi:MAG: FTR1 family protein [Dehalococcoidia bacterium]|nr:FTR1 family protein [Dehalococcoidia bacterium]